MQEYASAEQLPVRGLARFHDLTPPARVAVPSADNTAILDQLPSRIADLVVDRLVERTPSAEGEASEWMDAREAADYLGIHRDTLRKLAAQRAVPAHQDGPRCKLDFRRGEA